MPILTPTPTGGVASATTPPTPELSPLQLTAITLLCSGKSVPLAAAKLHIHRTTLFRWRTKNPAFIAELNRRQHDLHDTAARRLRLALLKAVENVTDEINCVEYEDRLKVSLTLLRHIDLSSLLAPPTALTTDQCTDHLIRADRDSRNCHPSMEVDDYDRTQYLEHLATEEHADSPPPHQTHTRLRGTKVTSPEPDPTP